MSIEEISALMRSGLLQVLKMVVPILGSALVVGLIVAIFLAITQIQEQTLTFLPKFLIIILVLGLLGGWMFTSLGNWTIDLFNRIPEISLDVDSRWM